jgi:hypothetical protein
MLKVLTEAAMINKLNSPVERNTRTYQGVLRVSCRCIFKVKPYNMLCESPVLALIYLVKDEIKMKSGN